MIVNPHGQVTTLTGYTNHLRDRAGDRGSGQVELSSWPAPPGSRGELALTAGVVVVSSPAPPGSRGQLARAAGQSWGWRR